MKNKQIFIRIMFIVILIILGIGSVIGIQSFLKQSTALIANATQETMLVYNQETTKVISDEIKVLSNELNTQIESIHAENAELRKVIEEQSKEIEKLNNSLQNLGLTFQ